MDKLSHCGRYLLGSRGDNRVHTDGDCKIKPVSRQCKDWEGRVCELLCNGTLPLFVASLATSRSCDSSYVFTHTYTHTYTYRDGTEHHNPLQTKPTEKWQSSTKNQKH